MGKKRRDTKGIHARRGTFFVNLLRLYSVLPAQAGYGNKRPS
jgi:hypothetical protein